MVLMNVSCETWFCAFALEKSSVGGMPGKSLERSLMG
jgi:hypothetical protein